jgi:hypothetical protein
MHTGTETRNESQPSRLSSADAYSAKQIKMPPVIAEALDKIRKGKAQREASGDYSGPSVLERNGRLMIAVDIAGHAAAIEPVKNWPSAFPWHSLERSDENSGARRAAAVEHVARVLDCEAEAAAKAQTLLRAWREMLDTGDETYAALMAKCAQQLRHMGVRLSAPPPIYDIPDAATRLTRRYDLASGKQREMGFAA